jgi:hypothetical protein
MYLPAGGTIGSGLRKLSGGATEARTSLLRGEGRRALERPEACFEDATLLGRETLRHI